MNWFAPPPPTGYPPYMYGPPPYMPIPPGGPTNLKDIKRGIKFYQSLLAEEEKKKKGKEEKKDEKKKIWTTAEIFALLLLFSPFLAGAYMVSLVALFKQVASTLQ